ncbi:hypothetical protein FE257_001208 [Aspergillus nanangensis]|uniref:Carboxylesterase type B domain-containing protein n=1 Tax=Aspergillus nanangensis TaxID=2582783 RepID=A0AAD4CED2_ASPNN|nr:hypothetical protein FE257_001208 [Aspergillus nanangensis]
MLLLCSVLLVALAAAFPNGPGVAFPNSTALPLLTLPYGTWRASQYDARADVYTFRNIRYAAPPVGNSRWAKPSPPEVVHDIQDGSYGHNCFPVPLPGFDGPPFANLTQNPGEDCLFLDVYVPGKVFRHHKKPIPVVVWFYGGSYVTGSKDQALGMGLYDGSGLIQQADQDLIVVTFNYRLGAFGFLAGEALKGNGSYHAGFLDQRAALSWVQSYIRLLGGDPDNVSAWGQSAGSGSILYHLLAEGGTLPPLFNKAFFQSPGFDPNVNVEDVEENFYNFTEAAGCGNATDMMQCLRSVDSSALQKGNLVVSTNINPVPDGSYIPQPAQVALAQESLMVSHVLDEGILFLPNPLPPGFLESYITNIFPPDSEDQVKRLVSIYKSQQASTNVSDKQIASELVRDVIFTCNIRALIEAYNSKPTWATQYSYIDGILNGTHTSELTAEWYNPLTNPDKQPLFELYQRYIVNHARTGDPNSSRRGKLPVFWPKVLGIRREEVGNVLDLNNDGFHLMDGDPQMLKTSCHAWRDAFVEVAG